MIVKYTPHDQGRGEAREWTINPRREIPASICLVIQKMAGMKFDDWIDACMADDIEAGRVLLWHLLKRDNPPLRFDDTPDFFPDELVVEADVEELEELRKTVVSKPLKPGFDESHRDQVLSAIDQELREKVAAGAGKALSNGACSTSTTGTA